VSVLCRFADVVLSERHPGQTFSSNQASPKNVYAPPRNIKRMNATSSAQVGTINRELF
jgi:hypothetical protein